MKNREQKKKGSTRRDFLKTAAATTAGALLGSYSSASVQTAEGRVLQQDTEAVPQSANERIHMGLIGTGGMGSEHLRSFMNLHMEKKENVVITALCDVAKPKLESNIAACEKKQGNKIKGYKDYRELLEDKNVDVVLIASPEHWHFQMAIDAMDAGKDIYVEKPMTLRLDDALQLRNWAMKSKQILVVGTQYMLEEKYHVAKKLIAEGAIGKPTCSQTSYCRNSKDGEWLYYTIDPQIVPGPNLDWNMWCGPLGRQPWDPEVYARWRRYRNFSTGIVGDLLVHMMTPIVMAVEPGWPVRVTATGGHYVDKKMENHDQVNLTVQFEKEHTMVVMGSTCNELGVEPVIRGHKGNIYLSSSTVLLRPERIYSEEVDEERIPTEEKVHCHDAIRLDWLKCCRTRQAPVSGVEHATKIMVIVDLATRSMWEGEAFTFDLKTMSAEPA